MNELTDTGDYYCIDCGFESPLMDLRYAKTWAAMHQYGLMAQSFLMHKVLEVAVGDVE